MTDDTMPLEKGVYQRPNSPHFWFHIKVPKDLRAVYGGQQWAEQVSLETADRREANLKAARLRAQWLDTFDRKLSARDRKASRRCLIAAGAQNDWQRPSWPHRTTVASGVRQGY